MGKRRGMPNKVSNNILVCKNVSADRAGIGFLGRRAKFSEIIEFKENELELDEVKQFFAKGRLKILYRNFEPVTDDMRTYLNSPESGMNKVELIDNVWEVYIS